METRRNIKNHPKTSKGSVIVLASTLLITATAARILVKNDDNIARHNRDTYEITDSASISSINSFMRDLRLEYQIEKSNIKTTVLNYLDNQLQGLSDEEQKETLKVLFNDNDTFANLYDYAISQNQIEATEIQYIEDDNALSNLEMVTSNEELMRYIKKYCALYGESEDLVVALAAHSIQNGQINHMNPLNINDIWANLDASRTVYNYEKGNKLQERKNNGEELKQEDWNKANDPLFDKSISDATTFERAVGNGIRCLMSSRKENSGKTSESLKYYFNGPINIISAQQDKDAEQFKNEILSYLMTYKNNKNINININLTMSAGSSTRQIQENFCSDDFKKELYDSYIEVMTELNKSIVKEYGKKSSIM